MLLQLSKTTAEQLYFEEVLTIIDHHQGTKWTSQYKYLLYRSTKGLINWNDIPGLFRDISNNRRYTKALDRLFDLIKSIEVRRKIDTSSINRLNLLALKVYEYRYHNYIESGKRRDENHKFVLEKWKEISKKYKLLHEMHLELDAQQRDRERLPEIPSSTRCEEIGGYALQNKFDVPTLPKNLDHRNNSNYHQANLSSSKTHLKHRIVQMDGVLDFLIFLLIIIYLVIGYLWCFGE